MSEIIYGMTNAIGWQHQKKIFLDHRINLVLVFYWRCSPVHFWPTSDVDLSQICDKTNSNKHKPYDWSGMRRWDDRKKKYPKFRFLFSVIYGWRKQSTREGEIEREKKANVNEWRSGNEGDDAEQQRTTPKNKPPTGSSIIINFNLLSSKRNVKVLGLAWILIDFMRKRIVNFG